MAGPDYTLKWESPPEPRKKGPPLGTKPRQTDELANNLNSVATRPGRFARVVSYGTEGVAKTVASKLRHGQKTTRDRPVGEWEFKTGITDEGRYGIWAKYTRT